MKKVLSLFLAITMLLSLAACSTTEDQLNSSSESSESSSAASTQETLDSSSSEKIPILNRRKLVKAREATS